MASPQDFKRKYNALLTRQAVKSGTKQSARSGTMPRRNPVAREINIPNAIAHLFTDMTNEPALEFSFFYR